MSRQQVVRKSGKRVETAANVPEIPHDSRPAQLLWPALEPLAPIEDLCIHQVLESQIITISNFWTTSLCKKYVKFLSGLPLTTTPGTPRRGDAVRVNDRFQVDDSSFAETLWTKTGLRELILEASENVEHEPWGGQVLGLNPNVRIYRYKKGQFFDQHYDDSNTLTFPSNPPVPARTTWTLLLYLTSASTGCVGGETVFYPEPPITSKKGKKKQDLVEPIVVGLETGMALLHRHGKDCMLHEGREVTEGEKWVIRSDLCVKR